MRDLVELVFPYLFFSFFIGVGVLVGRRPGLRWQSWTTGVAGAWVIFGYLAVQNSAGSPIDGFAAVLGYVVFIVLPCSIFTFVTWLTVMAREVATAFRRA